MVTPTILDVVLVAVMAVQNPITKFYEIYYEPLDYFKTTAECYKEQARLVKKGEKGVRYVCLIVDRN